MLDLTGTYGSTLAVNEEAGGLTFATRLDDDADVTLDARSVASLTISLLGWLNRQPAYEGLALEIATKHLEAKVRQARSGP